MFCKLADGEWYISFFGCAIKVVFIQKKKAVHKVPPDKILFDVLRIAFVKSMILKLFFLHIIEAMDDSDDFF